jgi:hypothetical protein
VQARSSGRSSPGPLGNDEAPPSTGPMMPPVGNCPRTGGHRIPFRTKGLRNDPRAEGMDAPPPMAWAGRIAMSGVGIVRELAAERGGSEQDDRAQWHPCAAPVGRAGQVPTVTRAT